jgi:2,3-bisphosphoglycerate-independent phosphoglycerate mutase
MKVLMLVCDGMADRPLKELKDRTPLEVARRENMDTLASKGINGILDPIAPGVRVGSDTTHLALLGYNPYDFYTGRGPFEALGAGLEVRKGDIAFRVNFATVDEDMVVLDRRAGRINEGTDKLAEAINRIRLPGVEVIFKESTGHRGALVMRGEELSCEVSDSDPHEPGRRVLEVKALSSSPNAAKTARLVNEFSRKAREVLKNHEVNAARQRRGLKPANMLLLRGCGVAMDIPSFEEKHGLRAGCMATTGLLRGIARSVGMELLETPEEYAERVVQGLRYLEKHDFLLLNIKEPDEAAHDGNPERKIELIETIDEALAPLLGYIEENYLLLLSDHTTATSYGDHTGDPVPVLIAGPGVRCDDVKAFDERSAAKGGLGRIRGRDLMPILLDLLNKSEKFGA